MKLLNFIVEARATFGLITTDNRVADLGRMYPSVTDVAGLLQGGLVDSVPQLGANQRYDYELSGVSIHLAI